MDSMLAWGLILLGLAIAAGIAELLIPSAGALGLTSGVLVIAGIICMFRHDTAWGISTLLAVAVLGPIAVSFAFKIWPHTPIGKRVLGVQNQEEVVKQQLEAESAKAARAALLGQEGTVLTDLRPVGRAEIAGKRYDVLSETTFVRAGTRVRVTSADMEQIKVRPLA